MVLLPLMPFFLCSKQNFIRKKNNYVSSFSFSTEIRHVVFFLNLTSLHYVFMNLYKEGLRKALKFSTSFTSHHLNQWIKRHKIPKPQGTSRSDFTHIDSGRALILFIQTSSFLVASSTSFLNELKREKV